MPVLYRSSLQYITPQRLQQSLWVIPACHTGSAQDMEARNARPHDGRGFVGSACMLPTPLNSRDSASCSNTLQGVHGSCYLLVSNPPPSRSNPPQASPWGPQELPPQSLEPTVVRLYFSPWGPQELLLTRHSPPSSQGLDIELQ